MKLSIGMLALAAMLGAALMSGCKTAPKNRRRRYEAVCG